MIGVCFSGTWFRQRCGKRGAGVGAVRLRHRLGRATDQGCPRTELAKSLEVSSGEGGDEDRVLTQETLEPPQRCFQCIAVPGFRGATKKIPTTANPNEKCIALRRL